MLNHLTEEQLVLYYYSEGNGSPEVRRHLDACEACRAEYGNLQRVLNVVGAAPVPERAVDYESQVWSRLEPSLGKRPRFILPWSWPVRTWAAVAGVAILVIAAFFAGRFSPRATQGSQQAASGPVRER